jgi:broad specificity phosphatase PhoE
VVVAHGGIIDASLIRFLRLPEHGGHVRLHAEHTSRTVWQYTGRRWRLVRYNDSSHLHDPGNQGELLAPPPDWVHTEL